MTTIRTNIDMKEKDFKDKRQVKVEQQSAGNDGSVKEFVPEDAVLDREAMGDEKYIEALEEKIGLCMAESVSARNIAMRLQADFDNYRKRNAGLAEEMKSLGKAMVIEKMLSVLDNCDLARKYLTDEAALQGFNMMERQILDALESFGLEEIHAEGEEFDAKVMSAVERVQSAGNEGKVVSVVAKGYKLAGKVLRPASVKVGC